MQSWKRAQPMKHQVAFITSAGMCWDSQCSRAQCSGTTVTMVVSLILLWICFCMVVFFIRTRRPKNFPPGPQTVPIFGNLLQLNLENPIKDLQRVSFFLINTIKVWASWFKLVQAVKRFQIMQKLVAPACPTCQLYMRGVGKLVMLVEKLVMTDRLYGQKIVRMAILRWSNKRNRWNSYLKL